MPLRRAKAALARANVVLAEAERRLDAAEQFGYAARERAEIMLAQAQEAWASAAKASGRHGSRRVQRSSYQFDLRA